MTPATQTLPQRLQKARTCNNTKQSPSLLVTALIGVAGLGAAHLWIMLIEYAAHVQFLIDHPALKG